MRSGQVEKAASMTRLESLFRNYIKGDRLKPNTLRNCKHVLFFYLSDWLQFSTVGTDEEVVRAYIRDEEQEDKRLEQLKLF